jgi:hypothetical protein
MYGFKKISEANENEENKQNKVGDYIENFKVIDLQEVLKNAVTNENNINSIKDNNLLKFDSPVEVREENKYQQNKNASVEK